MVGETVGRWASFLSGHLSGDFRDIGISSCYPYRAVSRVTGSDAPNLGVTEPQSRTDAPAVGRPGGSLLLLVWAFLGVAAMVGAWSLATPIGSAPDEAQHTTQAAAIVRGQFDVPEQSFQGQPASVVRVPCWVDNPWLRIECRAEHLTTGQAPTQFSNYPPLYYVVVGIPSLFLSGSDAIYGMNAVGDLLNAFIIAIGIWLLARYHPHRLVLLGALMALSPMVLFFAAVLNTSGLEITAAFASWCGLLCIVTYRRAPRSLVVWTATMLILLVLSRPASPLDLVVIVIVFAFYLGWPALRDRWGRTIRPSVISVAVALLIAVVFLFIDGQPHLIGNRAIHPAGLVSNMETTVRLTWTYVEQSVGDFGSAGNLPVQQWITVMWGVCVAALVAAALVFSRPCRRALPLLALAIVTFTVALEAPKLNAVGNYFSARYILPLLVGFALVGSSLEWRGRRILSRRTSTSCALFIGVALLVAQAAAFHGALHAYGTTVNGIYGVAAHWSPPGGALFVQGLFVLGALSTLTLVVVMTSGAGDPLCPPRPTAWDPVVRETSLYQLDAIQDGTLDR
jgi:hypothetical protein